MSPREYVGLEWPSLAVEPAGPVSGALAAPASKSVTNRLLVMAGLAEGTSTLTSPLVSDDTVAMARGLAAFGVGVEFSETTMAVTGRGGELRPPGAPVNAGLSGTTLRFLAAVGLLARGAVVLDGEPGLRKRPLGGLLAAIAQAGARVEATDGHAPVLIESSGLPGGSLMVDARASSQFATALLLISPYAASDTELVVEHLGAAGYVELTVDLMCRRGASVTSHGDGRFHVVGQRPYQPADERVEYDASAAAHLFSIALATGGEVTVTNAAETLQPDSELLGLFAEMGAEVIVEEAGGVTVRGAPGPLYAVNADLSAMPDQLATVAVLAVLAEGVTRLKGLGVTRGHETDRLAAVAGELSKLGASVEADEDSLLIRGGRRLHGGLVETYDDHRMAMAFSVLGTRVAGIRIASPGCVAKTYPSWWADLATLGVGIAP